MGKNYFDLVILEGPQEGKRLRFLEDSLTIGRTYDNQLVINSPTVSSHNSKIELENDRFYIEDLDSLNGTFVNNKKVQRESLYSGDKIEIGSAILLFMLKGEDPGTRPQQDDSDEYEPGKSTIVMTDDVRKLLSKKSDLKAGVPKVHKNPVVILLIVLIVGASAATLFLMSKPVAEITETTSKTATKKPTPGEEKIDLNLPRVDRGDLTTKQVIAKAEDYFRKGKQAYNGRKLKDANLYTSIRELKYCLAYLNLTEEKPPFYQEIQPLLESGMTELESEYNELIFLARKYSRQKNYEEARKHYETIRRKIPDKEDKRFQVADKAIKYLLSRNLIKPRL